MKTKMTATFLELGDMTSRNLEFSHFDNVWVSYGEETITEINLLEIRRRHPDLVRIWTFSNVVEGKNGADWEWHIVGRRRTLKMRVQAKRLQCNGILKVKHKVKSSGKQQRTLLVAGAEADGMKAVYCIYCTEPQRKVWKQFNAPPGYRSFQTGCLLADASHVLSENRRLCEIEEKCRPWHHLFAPAVLMQKEPEYFAEDVDDFVQFISTRHPRVPLVEVGKAPEPLDASGWNAPTIDDLNEDTSRDFDWTGVKETTEEDRARLGPDTETGWTIEQLDGERLRELGIHRMMVMDVRGDRATEE